ncbi:MAG: polysaccharide biosynthesis tyrosine autokinase [Syntrophobacteraceae bacterium]
MRLGKLELRMDMQWIRRIVRGRSKAEQWMCDRIATKLPQLGVCGPAYSKTKVIPVHPGALSNNRIILDDSDRVAEQFKMLRTLIFNRTRPQGWTTIQVTGFDAGEGKSLVATNLAISIARDSRQTTLLVDLDFRNPSIHTLLGLDPEVPGLASFFADRAGLEDILINPGIEKLTVLPAGGRILQAPELIGSSRMEALVKELKERYEDRYIVFDTPPMNGFPDALVFSEYVDSIILVARAGHTSRISVENTMDMVPRKKVLGLVFNDVRPKDMNGDYGSR